MSKKEITLPVFGISRHRMTTDGFGVTTLVGGYGCPLQCRYCLNPHAWNPKTLKACRNLTPQALYEELKIDDLYFKATNGGVTFGGGESLLHTDFIAAFRGLCPDWRIVAETSLHVPVQVLQKALEAVDEFIVDIKDMNPDIYEKYTGKGNEQVYTNLELLSKYNEKKQITIRIPLIDGYNTEEDREKSVEILRKMGFTEFDLFTYRKPEEKPVQ